ncbi:hypothetical protein CHUAL_008595 [Chamberlinius hualienensis]
MKLMLIIVVAVGITFHLVKCGPEGLSCPWNEKFDETVEKCMESSKSAGLSHEHFLRSIEHIVVVYEWLDADGNLDKEKLINSVDEIFDDKCIADRVKLGFNYCMTPRNCSEELEDNFVIECCFYHIFYTCFYDRIKAPKGCMYQDLEIYEKAQDLINRKRIECRMQQENSMDDCNSASDFFHTMCPSCLSENGELIRDEVVKHFTDSLWFFAKATEKALMKEIDSCFNQHAEIQPNLQCVYEAYEVFCVTNHEEGFFDRQY